MGLLSSESEESFLLKFLHFTAAIATTSNASGNVDNVTPLKLKCLTS